MAPLKNTDIRDGIATGLPILGAVVPFALVFGALCVQQGLTVADTMLISATVYAGASQMVAIDLWGQSVPAWTIMLSVFAVNFRHLLYSAAMTPIIKAERFRTKMVAFFFMVDPQFAFTERRAQRGYSFSMRWYMALAMSIYVPWMISTFIGARFGQLITNPQALGLDLLLPVYFLALVMGLRTRRSWGLVVMVAGLVSIAVSFAPQTGLFPDWLGPPWHVTIGGIAGVIVAACVPPQRPGRTVRDDAEESANAPPFNTAPATGMRS